MRLAINGNSGLRLDHCNCTLAPTLGLYLCAASNPSANSEFIAFNSFNYNFDVSNIFKFTNLKFKSKRVLFFKIHTPMCGGGISEDYTGRYLLFFSACFFSYFFLVVF